MSVFLDRVCGNIRVQGGGKSLYFQGKNGLNLTFTSAIRAVIHQFSESINIAIAGGGAVMEAEYLPYSKTESETDPYLPLPGRRHRNR